MTTVVIDIIGTKNFHDNHSSPVFKLDDVEDYIRDAWNTWIKDGSGDYDVAIFTWNDLKPDVVGGNLCDRKNDGDDKLDKNWSGYDSSDAIVLIDYYGADLNTYGCAYWGTAGLSCCKTALADSWWEDNNDLPPENPDGTEATAAHELAHLFGASHPNHVSTDTADHTSLIYSWDGVGCSDNGSTDEIFKWYSNCTVGEVRELIDNDL